MLTNDAFEPTLAGAVRKHWPVVFGMALLGMVLAILVQATVADNWVARGSLLVENPENSQLFDRQTATSPERYTADQVAILESSAIAIRAAEILAEGLGDEQASPAEVRGAVEIESTLDSGLIEVRVVHEDSDRAVAVANAMLQAYRENREEEAARGFELGLAEFDESITAVDEELDAISEAIAELRRPDAEGADIDAQLQTAVRQLAELLAQPEPPPADQLENAIQQLESLQLLRAVQVEDPSLATLIQARAQALERRSQLALRRDQLRVDAALASTGIALMSPATDAEQAVGPSRAAAIGLLAGLVLGGALAFALANRSRRFSHRAEPELILNAPVLAEVPDFEDESLASPLPIRDAPMSAAAESYRFAAAALTSHHPLDRPGRPNGGDSSVVAISSALLGEGKSVTAANLGMAAATKGRNVLLIDCDFGDPSLSEMLGVQPTSLGMTDVVEGVATLDQAVKEIDVGDGLSVSLLTRGSQRVTAPVFFRAPDTEGFFDSIRYLYDLVLVDVPPLLQVAYSGSVLGLCGRALMVVPHRSEVSRLVEALDRISLTDSQILGYVYNRSPLRREMTSTEGSMSDPLGRGMNRSVV